MKKTLLSLMVAYAANIGAISAQPSLQSLVGTYVRDDPKYNPNYEARHQPCFKQNIISTIPFQGYDERQSYQALGEVYYYTKLNSAGSCINTAEAGLTKPVIVLDGFDPLDGRSPAQIYGRYLKYLDTQTREQFLGDQLRSATPTNGYDVLVLNFPQYRRGGLSTITYYCPIPASYVPQPGQPTRQQLCQQMGYPRTISVGLPAQTVNGGGDYVERNAMVLVELLQRTNATLRANNSTEQIVIIGPSMGGLISRYALAYMEKRLAENPTDLQWRQQWNHNIRLWVSFDSPHLGANVPMGSQWWVYLVQSIFGAEDAKNGWEKRLGSKAARQMLLRQAWNIQDPSINYRANFMQNLEGNGTAGSLGFPQNTRRVALVNGAINGAAQREIRGGVEQSATIQPGGLAFRNEVKLSRGVRGLALLKFNLIGLATYALASVPISQSQVYFTPANNNAGLVTYLEAGSLPFIKSEPAFNAGASIDASPGGYYVTQADLAEGEVNKSFLESFVFKPRENYYKIYTTQVNFTSVVDNHSFIPTKSALGFNWRTPTPVSIGDLGENLNGRALVCEGTVPFNSYYAPSKNESHVFLTNASVQWILQEINKNPQKATATAAFSITTSGNLGCIAPNNIITASVPDQGSGSTYAWSVTAGMQITAGQGTRQVTIQSSGPGTSTETVSMSVETACAKLVPASASVQKSSQGYVSSDYPVTGPSQAQCNQLVSYSTAILPGATNYQWFVSNGVTNLIGQGTPNLSFMTPVTTVALQVGVRVATACDAGGSPAFKFTTISCSGGRRSVEAYPNPADFELTVAQTEISLTSPTQGDGTLSVQLYDTVGRRVAQGQTKHGKVTLAVGHLPTGVYLVQGKDGSGQSFTQRVALRR